MSTIPTTNDASGFGCEARIVLKNNSNELGRLAGFVQQFADDAPLNREAAFALDIALTEWVTNILSYGSLGSEHGMIDVRLFASPAELRAEIEDNGKIFNPLSTPAVDTTLPVAEKPIGGLGIHLIRKLMDEVLYERRHDKNRLVMRKSLAPGS